MSGDSPHGSSATDSSSIVSRRSFIRSTGAAGITTAVAGCSGGNDGTQDANSDTAGSQSGQTTNSTSSGTTTVVFNNSLKGKAWEEYKAALHRAGLPDDIELKNTPLPEKSRKQAWKKWLTTDQKDPDIFMIEPSGAPFIRRGYLANASKYVSDETEQIIKEKMPDQLVALYTQKGDIYGVPFLFDIGVLQYRKDLVKKAGYQPDKENWQQNPLSWEKFSKVMRDARDAGGVDYGYGWSTQKHTLASSNFFEFTASHGGAYWNGVRPDKKIGEREASLTEKPVTNSIRMGRSFIYGEDDKHSLDGVVSCSPKAVLQWSDDNPVKQMKGGNMAGMRNWTWSVPVLGEEKAFGKDLGVMPLPFGVKKSNAMYDGRGGSQSVQSGWYVAINGNTDHPEAAGKVLDAMVTKEAQIALFKHQGYAPTRPKLFESEAVQNMDVIGRYADALAYAAQHTGGFPGLNPLWSRERKMINSKVMASLKQQQAPKTAMKQAAEKVERFEDQYKDQY